MGKPATLLEGICGHVLTFGANSIEVEYRDHREWVTSIIDGARVPIANYLSTGSDGKELRGNLYAAAKKPVRTVLGGKVCILTVRVLENSFEVRIDLSPKRDPATAPSFTAKQGQYLAFIHHYSKIHRQPPAEADLVRYFQVSAPSIHTMIKTLERNGLIEKTPGHARSIRLLVLPEHLPRLE